MQTALLNIIAESLDIKVSKRTINENSLQVNTNLASLSDQLKEWNVNCLAVKIEKEQLTQIPYPAVAHLKLNLGRFVVLQKLEMDLLHYVDPEVGHVAESIKEFETKWTGVVLLIETNEKSGEEGYEQRRKYEIFEHCALFISLFLLMISWILPLFVFISNNLTIYILNTLGCGISFLLLQKQLGLNSTTLNSFCKLGSKVDCDSVINSPASRIFGIINLSELGLWYFTGSLLSTGLAALSSGSVEPFLFLFTLVGTPLSFLSIYYQAVVLRKWCPLCIAVVIVLWVQAGFYLIFPPIISVSFKSFAISFIGFSLPLILWLSVRKRVLDSFKVPNLERTLNLFLKSDRIFQKLLEDQPSIEAHKFAHELQSGSPDSPVQLIVVSNPVCGPCAYTHAVLDNLKDFFDERVNIIYRFIVNTCNPGSVSYQMLETLFAIQQTESNERALEALSGWYQSNNLEKWKKLYSPTNQLDLDVSHILKEHEHWCANVAIQKTPTIIINGKLLPEEYSVTDLKFQLRKLAEKITESESVS